VADKSEQALAVHEIDWPNISDDELLAFVDCHYEAGKNRRANWEHKAAEQLAWARGDQELRWDEASNELTEAWEELYWGHEAEELPMDERRPIKLNTIKGMLLQKIAVLLARPITHECSAMAEDDDDLAASSLGERLLQWQWFCGDRPTRARIMEAMWTVFCTGLVVVKAYWDPNLGRRDWFGPPAKAGRKGLAAFRAKLERLLNRQITDKELDKRGGMELAAGQPVMEFRSPFDITEPEFCTDVPFALWMIDSRWVSIEELRADFPAAAAKEVEADNYSEAYHSGWRPLYGPRKDAGGGREEPCTMVLKHELWRPKTRWLPEGFFGVVAGDRVLRKGPHPYDHGRLPFARLVEHPDPDLFRPSCTVGDLMSAQEARNRTMSRANAYVAMRCDPKVMHEASAEFPPDALTPGPRSIKVADGALGSGQIKALELPPLPPETLQFDHAVHESIKDVGGVHDATAGRKTDASESGRHAALLQAADARRNTVSRELLEAGLAEGGDQCLHLWHQFTADERILELTGQATLGEVIRFKGKDLLGNRNSPRFSVLVHLGFEPDLGRALEEIGVLAKLGFLRPDRPADHRRIQRLLGYDLARGEDNPDARERSNAGREHAILGKGKQLAPNLGDEHQIHIEEHLHWTTTGEYRRIVKRNDKVAVLLLTHIRAHQYRQAEWRIRQKVIDEVVLQHLQQKGAELVSNDRPTPSEHMPTPGRVNGQARQRAVQGQMRPGMPAPGIPAGEAMPGRPAMQ